MQPYIIRQGDHLSSVAYRCGFDADAVWNDPKNAQLRQVRPDPNILDPGDVLYIPDQDAPPVMKSLTTGSTNAFVSDAPTVTLTQQFIGPDATTYASRAYTIQELDQLTGLATDENGFARFPVPVTLATATLVFTDTGELWALRIGEMDPINTPLGIFKRLQNLGYLGLDVQFDSSSLANNSTCCAWGFGPSRHPKPVTVTTPPARRRVVLSRTQHPKVIRDLRRVLSRTPHPKVIGDLHLALQEVLLQVQHAKAIRSRALLRRAAQIAPVSMTRGSATMGRLMPILQPCYGRRMVAKARRDEDTSAALTYVFLGAVVVASIGAVAT